VVIILYISRSIIGASCVGDMWEAGASAHFLSAITLLMTPRGAVAVIWAADAAVSLVGSEGAGVLFPGLQEGETDRLDPLADVRASRRRGRDLTVSEPSHTMMMSSERRGRD
jgi:hypothetical protein